MWNNSRSKKRNIIGILAMQGSGKSALMQYLLMINPKSCIIFDPVGSLQPYKNRVFIDFERQSVKKILNKIGKRIYTQKIDIVIHNCNDLEAVLGLIYNNLTNICIVIDEIDIEYKSFVNNTSYLYKICNFGRHKELDLIGVARRPANMPRILTSQSNYLFLGNSNQEPLDLKYIREFVDKKTYNDYLKLSKYSFLCYNTSEHSSNYLKLPLKALEKLNIQ